MPNSCVCRWTTLTYTENAHIALHTLWLNAVMAARTEWIPSELLLLCVRDGWCRCNAHILGGYICINGSAQNFPWASRSVLGCCALILKMPTFPICRRIHFHFSRERRPHSVALVAHTLMLPIQLGPSENKDGHAQLVSWYYMICSDHQQFG